MAVSPAHKFGQIVGKVLEKAVEPFLARFAQDHGLYLDKKGPRPTRKGKNVRWADLYGNQHDLDFVMERNGSGTALGVPVAFIEVAWRRYRRHSRAKAQEIQGPIRLLGETYRNLAPFLGVVLAGTFTEGALDQLGSLGFSIVYFPYDSVMEAFKTQGIDANHDENSPDDLVAAKIAAWNALPMDRQLAVARSLAKTNAASIERFVEALDRCITRRIQTIRIRPLHGVALVTESVEEAATLIAGYSEQRGSLPVAKYELEVCYTNGDRIGGEFQDKSSALEFLRKF